MARKSVVSERSGPPSIRKCSLFNKFSETVSIKTDRGLEPVEQDKMVGRSPRAISYRFRSIWQGGVSCKKSVIPEAHRSCRTNFIQDADTCKESSAKGSETLFEKISDRM